MKDKLDDERFRAIENARAWLFSLAMERPMKRKATNLRRNAFSLLKHYPETWFMKKLEKLYFSEKEKRLKMIASMRRKA